MESLGHLTPEQRRKLDLITESAKTSEEGIRHFFELSSKPVTSVFLHTGPLVNDESEEHEIRVEVVSQPDTYPTAPNNMYATQQEAYADYYRKKLAEYRTDETNGLNAIYFLVFHWFLFIWIGIIHRI
jgi:hypothetical protein